MKEKLTIKLTVSETWNNKYKNGHYKDIDIKIINNIDSKVIIDKIELVIVKNEKIIPLSKLVLEINEISSTPILIENNKNIYALLKFYGFIFDDFYLLFTYKLKTDTTNIINDDQLNKSFHSKSDPINISKKIPWI